MTDRGMILPILISLVLHALAVSLFGVAQINWNGKRESVLMVELIETPGEAREVKDETKGNAPAPPPAKAPAGEWSELSLEQENQPSYRAYIREVKERIQRQWRHPPEVQQGKLQGITVIRLRINRGGNLLKASLEQSSGSALLDRQSLQAIQGAAPFGAMPDDLDLATLQVVARFRYHMD